MEERIMIISKIHIYICDFNFGLEKLTNILKIPFSEISKIEYGISLINSYLGIYHILDDMVQSNSNPNYGVIIHYNAFKDKEQTPKIYKVFKYFSKTNDDEKTGEPIQKEKTLNLIGINFISSNLITTILDNSISNDILNDIKLSSKDLMLLLRF